MGSIMEDMEVTVMNANTPSQWFIQGSSGHIGPVIYHRDYSAVSETFTANPLFLYKFWIMKYESIYLHAIDWTKKFEIELWSTFLYNIRTVYSYNCFTHFFIIRQRDHVYCRVLFTYSSFFV